MSERYVIKFSKGGYAKYTSHLDLLRFFKRAFRKTGVDLKYSQGFNPHPNLSFAQPLSLGYLGDNELVEFETNTCQDPVELENILKNEMPKGLDTYITEDGSGMSQGQKQLLCITRVMLDLPAMLILDEATSSIDTRTEIKIQEAFRRMMKGRTSFIVAHRLSTIKEADTILVMKEGNIIEQGSHEELLQKNGFYKKLYESQF